MAIHAEEVAPLQSLIHATPSATSDKITRTDEGEKASVSSSTLAGTAVLVLPNDEKPFIKTASGCSSSRLGAVVAAAAAVQPQLM